MEVKIRLQRAGKIAKGRYNFRIVAMSKTKPRDSKHLEIIGYYDAAKNPAVISVDQAKLDKWINNGALMTPTVKSLVKKSKKTSKTE